MTDGVVVTTNVSYYSLGGVIQGGVATADVIPSSSSGFIIGNLVTTEISYFSFAYNVVYGIVVTVMQSCPETGASVLIYYMTAWDGDGAQYVYWETEDQYLNPVATQPAAVGTLSDFRILAKRIA